MTFDWTTFALQLVNVLVLLAILRHFLFRPVAAIIAKRQAETQAALDGAAAAKTAAEAATAAARAEAEASVAARSEVLQKAAKEAETQRAALLEKARAEAARIIEDGKTTRERNRAAEAGQQLERVRDLAMAIARRALLAQPADPEGYADRLAKALDAMEAAPRKALLDGTNLRLIAAAKPPEGALKAAEAALERYGAKAPLMVDPALIAGLDLRSDSGLIANSLSHDLDTLAKALTDDDTAG